MSKRPLSKQPSKAIKVLSYDEFRTGLTYIEVYYIIYNRKWKRRNGVLGYWHELKMNMYREYLEQIGVMDEVPF